MLATFEQLPHAMELPPDITQQKLRTHIAKMIAKILGGRRPQKSDGERRVGPAAS